MGKQVNYHDDWRTTEQRCTRCGWAGQGSVLAAGNALDILTEYNCPGCDELLLSVLHPTLAEQRANWDKLSDGERQSVERVERRREQMQREQLREPADLPDVSLTEFTLSWDLLGEEKLGNLRTAIMLGDEVLFSEPASFECYERFENVARILKAKYGARLKDLVPTERSELYLYGDRLSAWDTVEKVRKELFSTPAAADPGDGSA